MNEVQSFIQNFAGNLEGYQQVNEFMRSQYELISQNQEHTLKLIKNNTDAARNSLIQLWLISALFVHKHTLHRHLAVQDQIELLNNYLNNFVYLQITSQQKRFFMMASLYADLLLSEKKAIYGIKTLQNTILKVRDNNEQVCGTLHKEYARLCIKAKCYQHSQLIINHPVTSFKKQTTPMDILNYIYYKSLIYTGLKQYQNAIDCLKLVISYPTHVTHKIHIESYKKLVLLNLIEKGSMPDIPKYTSMILKHNLENSFIAYKNLGNAYTQKDDKLFNEVIMNNSEEFYKDKNSGLIKKLQKKYHRVRVQELSNTYLTLRYNEIRNSVSSFQDNVQIEEVLFEMINADQSQAKIDSQKEMISFIDSNSVTSANQGDAKEAEYLTVIEELESQNQRIIKLMAQIQGLDNGLQLSKQYLQRTLLGKGPAGIRDDSGGDMMM